MSSITMKITDAVRDTFKTNIGPSINSVPSDSFTGTTDSVTGSLEVVNEFTKEMAGGLVAENIDVPTNFTAHYYAWDVAFTVDAEDMPHLARCENDMKVTFPGGAQANGSLQWNDDKKTWQLDPTGKTWVDSGYSEPLVIGRNTVQMRLFFDGTKWSITGLRVNNSAPFTPDPAVFANIPALNSGWGQGEHPQLQTEGRKGPWHLRETYDKVRCIAADAPIPWEFGF
jgi:hypothetical protein